MPQLNDDCLLGIFSHLSLDDLCAVKDCSSRFSDLADSTVRRRMQNETYVCDVEDLFGVKSEQQVIVAKFGKFVTKLQLYGEIQRKGTTFIDPKSSQSFQECTSLRTLRLTRVNLSLLSSRIRSVSCVLQNIKSLELEHCHGSYWQHVRISKACTMLRNLTLKLEAVTDDLKSINDCENLECIDISASTGDSDEIRILQQIQKLKKLTFRDIYDADDNFFEAFNKFTHLVV